MKIFPCFFKFRLKKEHKAGRSLMLGCDFGIYILE